MYPTPPVCGKSPPRSAKVLSAALVQGTLPTHVCDAYPVSQCVQGSWLFHLDLGDTKEERKEELFFSKSYLLCAHLIILSFQNLIIWWLFSHIGLKKQCGFYNLTHGSNRWRPGARRKPWVRSSLAWLGRARTPSGSLQFSSVRILTSVWVLIWVLSQDRHGWQWPNQRGRFLKTKRS